MKTHAVTVTHLELFHDIKRKDNGILEEIRL